MTTRGAGNKAKLCCAIAAAAIGLGVAAGGAYAKPPAAGGVGNPNDLAAMLEWISTAPETGRREAADAFVTATVGADMVDVVAAVLPALGDYREEQRYYALTGLGAAGLASIENGEGLFDVAQALVDSLADDSASVRTAAAATLAAIQPNPPDWAAGPLTDLLDDPEPRVVSAAMRALERLSANYAGLDPVYEALDGDNAGNRSRAARVIGAQGASTGDPTSAWMLAGALGDPDAGVRWQTATALGGLGDAGMIGVRNLKAVSHDPAENPGVRRTAETAINTILK